MNLDLGTTMTKPSFAGHQTNYFPKLYPALPMQCSQVSFNGDWWMSCLSSYYSHKAELQGLFKGIRGKLTWLGTKNKEVWSQKDQIMSLNKEIKVNFKCNQSWGTIVRINPGSDQDCTEDSSQGRPWTHFLPWAHQNYNYLQCNDLWKWSEN